MQVVDFGAFVSLPNAKEGLVHISELHHERVEAVTDYLNVGDKVSKAAYTSTLMPNTLVA